MQTQFSELNVLFNNNSDEMDGREAVLEHVAPVESSVPEGSESSKEAENTMFYLRTAEGVPSRFAVKIPYETVTRLLEAVQRVDHPLYGVSLNLNNNGRFLEQAYQREDPSGLFSQLDMDS